MHSNSWVRRHYCLYWLYVAKTNSTISSCILFYHNPYMRSVMVHVSVLLNAIPNCLTFGDLLIARRVWHSSRLWSTDANSARIRSWYRYSKLFESSFQTHSAPAAGVSSSDQSVIGFTITASSASHCANQQNASYSGSPFIWGLSEESVNAVGRPQSSQIHKGKELNGLY